jgi:hypothetical protein
MLKSRPMRTAGAPGSGCCAWAVHRPLGSQTSLPQPRPKRRRLRNQSPVHEVPVYASQAHKRLVPACTSGIESVLRLPKSTVRDDASARPIDKLGAGPPGLCCLISSLAARVPWRNRCDGRTAVCQLARWSQSRCRTECRKAIWRMLWVEMSDYSSGGQPSGSWASW